MGEQRKGSKNSFQQTLQQHASAHNLMESPNSEKGEFPNFRVNRRMEVDWTGGLRKLLKDMKFEVQEEEG